MFRVLFLVLVLILSCVACGREEAPNNPTPNFIATTPAVQVLQPSVVSFDRPDIDRVSRVLAHWNSMSQYPCRGDDGLLYDLIDARDAPRSFAGNSNWLGVLEEYAMSGSAAALMVLLTTEEESKAKELSLELRAHLERCTHDLAASNDAAARYALAHWRANGPAGAINLDEAEDLAAEAFGQMRVLGTVADDRLDAYRERFFRETYGGQAYQVTRENLESVARALEELEQADELPDWTLDATRSVVASRVRLQPEAEWDVPMFGSRQIPEFKELLAVATDVYSRPANRPFNFYSDPSGWIIWSAGPDRIYDVPWQVLDFSSAFPVSRLIAHTYDPKSGAFGKGDLWIVKTQGVLVTSWEVVGD